MLYLWRKKLILFTFFIMMYAYTLLLFFNLNIITNSNTICTNLLLVLCYALFII